MPVNRAPVREGLRRSVVHTFSAEEVRAFAEMSGDRGVQHIRENAQGQLMVHGLLLATLPTQIGGELNFLARELTFEFLQPAWTSMAVRCEVIVTKVHPVEAGLRLESEWECRDPKGATLMRGRGRGLIPHVLPQGGPGDGEALRPRSPEDGDPF